MHKIKEFRFIDIPWDLCYNLYKYNRIIIKCRFMIKPKFIVILSKYPESAYEERKMNKKIHLSKRIIATFLTLAMLLSTVSSLLVFGASAESESLKGNMTDGKVIANNYDLTDAEEKLLSSGYLVGDTYSYKIPGASDNLISINTDDKTVTAKSFEGATGYMWNPVLADVVVNNEVVETIKFSDNKASYTTDAAAFSVKVKYAVECEIDADKQELLLNAPADLKNDIDLLDELLDPNGEVMSAVNDFVYYSTQKLPENSDNPNASVKGALQLLAEDGYKYSIQLGGNTTVMTMQFKAPIKSPNEGIKYGEIEAASKLLAQLNANDGKLNLTVISEEYAAANSKVEFLVNNLERIQEELLNTYECLYALTGDEGTLNNAAYLIGMFGDESLSDVLDIYIASIVALSGDKEYKTISDGNKELVVREIGLLEQYMADGAWKTEGKTLVREDLSATDYVALDLLVQALGDEFKGPTTAVRNPLILDATSIQFNMAMYDVTVNVILNVTENKYDSKDLVQYNKQTVKITLPQNASEAEILSAVEKTMVEQNALAAWAGVYVAEHFDRATSELPDSLTGDVSFNIIYTPKSYVVDLDYADDITVPYGYQLRLPLHADAALAYDYWVDGSYNEQGSIIVINGDTTVTRKEGKAYTTTTVNAVVAQNFFAGSDKATAILNSGALTVELGNTKVNVRVPEASDNLVSLTDDVLKASDYASGYEGLVWEPFTYTVVNGTDSNVYFFNGANEVAINESYDRVDVIYRLSLTNLSDIDDLLAMPGILATEADDQIAALNKLNGYYDQMGDITSGMLGGLKGFIDGSESASAESKTKLIDAINGITSKCMEGGKLKLYNLLAGYRAQGLTYYYQNSAAFIGEINAMSEYLSVIIEEEALLKEIVGGMGDSYAGYIDKIGKLEGAMAELKNDLKAPNAAIDVNSNNLDKLTAALTMQGAIPAVTADTMYLTSSVITIDAPDKVTVSVTVQGQDIPGMTFSKDHVLTQDDVDAIKDAIDTKLEALNVSDKYYTTDYDADIFDDMVGSRVEDLEKVNFAITYTPKNFVVKVDGTDDQTVNVEDLSIVLPSSGSLDTRYDYYINGKKLDVAADGKYTFSQEQFEAIVAGNGITVAREIVDLAEEKYLALVDELNEAADGEIVFALTKNGDEYAIIMKMTSFDPSTMASSMQGLATALINYPYVAFDDNAFIYDNGSGTKVSLQALINTILNSGFSSDKLIEMINADGTVNSMAMPGEVISDVEMTTAGAMLAATELRLGDSKDALTHSIPMYITMAKTSDSVLELRNLLADSLKEYFGFSFVNGKAVLSLNMPQKAYEAYLAVLLATDNVDITDINAINEDVAIGFLENFIRPLMLDENVDAGSVDNTLHKLGFEKINFSKYNQAFERIRHFYNSTQFEYDNVDSTYGSSIIIDIEKYLDKVDLGQFSTMIAEKESGIEIPIGATILNLDKTYEALYFDIAGEGITKKFGLVTDIAAKLDEMKGTAVVLLVSDVEGDLVFNTTTVLNLNGFTVTGNINAENGSVRVVDSSIDEGRCGVVTGTISGNVRLAGGKYSYDVSDFVPAGYEQEDGVVYNKFVVLARDEAGNINVKLNAGTLSTEGLPDLKTLVVDILVELLLNGYSANSLYLNDNKLYSLTVDDVIGLYAATDRKDALIKQAMSMVDGEALANVLNILLTDLTDFQGLSESLDADIANETESPLFSYDLTTGTWGISLEYVEDGDYIDISITDGEPKDCKLNIMLSGTTEEKQRIADVLGLMADTVDIKELSVVSSVGKNNSEILFYAGLNFDVDIDITSNPEYAIMFSVIAADGIGAPANEALVAGLKDYFESETGNMSVLAEAFNDLTLAQLITAVENYDRKDSLASMMVSLGLGDYTDSIKTVESDFVAFAKLIAMLARRVDVTGPSIKLSRFMDEDYSYTLDRENINKVFEHDLPAGYSASMEFELIDVFASMKIFNVEDLPVVPEIDYTELSALIATLEGEDLNAENYTIDSWTHYQETLNDARALIDNATTQAQVDNMVAALQGAYDGLIPAEKIDDTEWNALLATIGALIDYDYTEETWDSLQKAIIDATNMFNSATNQAEADAAVAVLQAAYDGLILAEIDDTAWNALLEAIAELIDYDYTKATWDNLQNTIPEATEMFEKATKRSEANAALSVLESAYNGLELAEVNYEDLSNKVTEIETEIENDTLIQGDYTEESWLAFQQALEKAQKLLGNASPMLFRASFANVTKQSDVNAALAELKEAYDNLTYAPVDYTDLKAELDSIIAENYLEIDYTDDTWNAFSALIAKANALIDNAEKQSDVDALLAELQAARNDLALAEIDDAEWNALMATIDALEKINYTDDSWNALQEAIANSTEMFESATKQSEANAAVAVLQAAYDDLDLAEIDDTEWNALIATINGLISTDYTDDTWNALQDVKVEATEMFENATKQSEANEAVAILQAAYALLDLAEVDYSELKAELDSIANADYIVSDFTDDTWNAFSALIAKAEALIDNAEKQSDVDALLAELQAARKALEYKPVDYTDLKAELDSIIAENYLEIDYTDDTWNAFSALIAKAEALIDNAEKQSDVDALLAELQAARNDLVLAEIDDAEWNALMATIDALEKIDYTEGSWNALQGAIANATEMFESATKQSEANAAVAVLQAAYDDLDLAEIDDTEWNALIATINGLISTDYTDDTWDALQDAKVEATEMFESATKQSEANAAVDFLRDAFGALRRAELVYDAWESLIATIDALVSYDYTEETWNALQDAKKAAINNVGLAKLQSDIDAAVESLQEAYDGLDLAEVDYTKLEKELEDIANAGYIVSDFTVDSWNAFDTLKAAAEALINNAEKQSDVTAMLTDLQAARKALEYKPVDYTELKAELDSIANAGYVAGYYTATTLDAFNKVKAEAEVLIDNAEKQSDVTAMLAALKDARKALIALDYASLEALIAEYGTLDKNIYTAGSWDAFAATLETAKALVGKAATQEEINKAVEDLQSAYAALVKMNFTALEELIAEYEALDESIYTANSWDSFKAVLDAAKALVNNTRDQAEVDKKVTDLRAAYLALVKKIIYTALENLIAEIEAENLDATLYTTETWMNLQNALTAAKDLINKAPDQAAVDAACKALQDARAALTLKPVEPDKPVIDYSALKNEIAKIEAEGLKAEDYTAESWAAFQSALENAKALIDKANEQSEVANALAALKAAYESLEKKPATTPDDPNKPAPEIPADYTALKEAIAKANALNEEDYTASSWLELQKALANAEKALESKDQTVVDEATAALNSAIDALEEKKQQSSLLWLLILLIVLASLATIGVIIFVLVIKKKKETEDSTPLVDYDIDEDNADGVAADAGTEAAEANEAEANEAEANEAEAEEASAEEAEAEEANADAAEADEAETEANDAEEQDGN